MCKLAGCFIFIYANSLFKCVAAVSLAVPYVKGNLLPLWVLRWLMSPMREPQSTPQMGRVEFGVAAVWLIACVCASFSVVTCRPRNPKGIQIFLASSQVIPNQLG